MTDDSNGVLALYGGRPFDAHDQLDTRLLGEVGALAVVVLPTADAFEQPHELAEAAERWGGRIGVTVDVPMVLQRQDVTDDVIAEIDGAAAVYVAGDSAAHLRSVLKDSALLAAIARVVDRGGLLVAVGASASALCDPMFDERGGAFTLGLGVVTGRAVIPTVESWSDKALDRARQLADVPLAELASTAAVVRRGDDWEPVGAVAGNWFS